jgi:hypothetical protein
MAVFLLPIETRKPRKKALPLKQDLENGQRVQGKALKGH